MSTKKTNEEKPAEFEEEQSPMKPEDADLLRRMIQSIESEMDRTHIVFIKVLNGSSRIYRVGPEDRRDLEQLKTLLVPAAPTAKEPAHNGG